MKLIVEGIRETMFFFSEFEMHPETAAAFENTLLNVNYKSLVLLIRFNLLIFHKFSSTNCLVYSRNAFFEKSQIESSTTSRLGGKEIDLEWISAVGRSVIRLLGRVQGWSKRW